MQGKLVAATTALALALVGSAAASAATVPGCAGSAPGGTWTSYGGGLDNARDQRAETTIGPSNAGSLAPVWDLKTADGGTFQTTPVIADGCMFIGSSTGKVYARNADTGEPLWTTDLVTAPQYTGSDIIGAPLVANGRVYVDSTIDGAPDLVAIDEATGAIAWRTPIERNPPANDVYTDSSPVLFDGMIFIGFNGQETHDGSRGGYDLIDATTGTVIAHRYVIPDDRYKAGYEGASIWATPAIDPRSKYLYVGTGNAVGDHEDPYASAMIKIDVDRKRATFGEIVGSYHGDYERYAPPPVGDQESPACKQSLTWPANRASCGQLLDVDFGASPNLYRDGQGHEVMGELQKSGTFWAVDAKTMQLLWSTKVSAPSLGFNLGSTAFDGKNVYVGASGVGQVYALDKTTGAIKWVAAAPDIVRFGSMTVANGVVYTVNGLGFLQAWDAADGTPLLTRPFAQDKGGYEYDGGNSDGISVARNTIYTATATHVIAYKAPPGGAPAMTSPVVGARRPTPRP